MRIGPQVVRVGKWLLLVGGLVATFVDAQVRGDSRSLTVGLAYSGLAAVSLAFLRDADELGLWAIIFLFAVVWATDILAYFVGRAVGGPKLAPAISPGKTWSGAVGGALGGIAAGLVVAAAFGEISLSLALVGALLSVVSQIGAEGLGLLHGGPELSLGFCVVALFKRALSRRQGFLPRPARARIPERHNREY